MKLVLSMLLVVLVLLLVGLVGLAILLGWSVGLGWVLIQLLPFTLFEASLLIMAGTAVIGFVEWRILSIRAPDSPWADEDEDDDTDDDDYPIREVRFLEDAPGKTGETVFRYQMANDLFLYFRDNPRIRGQLGEKQLEELVIRLTDILVVIWKSKKFHGQRVSVTTEAMRKQMEKMGQRPYDEDILQSAVSCANLRLSYDEELTDIVIAKRWDEVWLE